MAQRPTHGRELLLGKSVTPREMLLLLLLRLFQEETLRRISKPLFGSLPSPLVLGPPASLPGSSLDFSGSQCLITLGNRLISVFGAYQSETQVLSFFIPVFSCPR